MKVRIKAGLTGLYNGRVWPGVGETVDVPDVVAAGLLDGGFAEKVSEKATKVETATPPTANVEKRGPGRPPKPKAETTKVHIDGKAVSEAVRRHDRGLK